MITVLYVCALYCNDLCKMNSLFSRNKPIPILIAFLRIILGWHFLYEGLIKLLNPDWSARPYLEGSRWIFGDLFRRMAESDIILQIVDSLNAWGLTLTGFALMVGFFTRIASWTGIAMLLLYYLAYPPLGDYA